MHIYIYIYSLIRTVKRFKDELDSGVHDNFEQFWRFLDATLLRQSIPTIINLPEVPWVGVTLHGWRGAVPVCISVDSIIHRDGKYFVRKY